MVDVGEKAPDFTVPLVTDVIEPFTLSAHLDQAPIVLAFYPGAFTGVCRTEMCSFDEQIPRYEDLGATVFGVSVDTPFSLDAWREQEGLSLGLLSDHDKTIVDAYDVTTDFESLGYHNLAKRAVFVVDADREVTYKWVSDDPGLEPDYEEVAAAAEAAAREA